MYVADHLSRASMLETAPDEEEIQIFSMDLEDMNLFDAVTISSERLPQLQKMTEQDPVMQTLKTTLLTG